MRSERLDGPGISVQIFAQEVSKLNRNKSEDLPALF
jgi:hypothetical protein